MLWRMDVLERDRMLSRAVTVVGCLTLVLNLCAVAGTWLISTFSFPEIDCQAVIRTSLWKECASYRGDPELCDALFPPPACKPIDSDGTFWKTCQVFTVLAVVLSVYALSIRPVVPRLLPAVQPNTVRKAALLCWLAVSLSSLVTFSHFNRRWHPDEYDESVVSVTEKYGFGFVLSVLAWLLGLACAYLTWKQDESAFEIDLESPTLFSPLFASLHGYFASRGDHAPLVPPRASPDGADPAGPSEEFQDMTRTNNRVQKHLDFTEV